MVPPGTRVRHRVFTGSTLVLVVAGVDERAEDGEGEEGEDGRDHQAMVAAFPLGSLSPSEKVHKSRTWPVVTYDPQAERVLAG